MSEARQYVASSRKMNILVSSNVCKLLNVEIPNFVLIFIPTIFTWRFSVTGTGNGYGTGNGSSYITYRTQNEIMNAIKQWSVIVYMIQVTGCLTHFIEYKMAHMWEYSARVKIMHSVLTARGSYLLILNTVDGCVSVGNIYLYQTMCENYST